MISMLRIVDGVCCLDNGRGMKIVWMVDNCL